MQKENQGKGNESKRLERLRSGLLFLAVKLQR